MKAPALRELLELPPAEARHQLGKLHDKPFRSLVSELLALQQTQRQERQLLYYQPVSSEAARVHESIARRIGVFGGNRASKTDTCLADLSVCATGIIPTSLKHLDWTSKFRGPRRMRVVVQSLTTTLHPTILPKLQYWRWNGDDVPGGPKGHWGWIPKECLIGGSWEKSWSEKLRTLKVLCRNPENTSEVLGESTFQFMCLRGDQRAERPDGTWTEIRDLRKGDLVMGHDGSVEIEKTFRYRESAPLYRIRCDGGHEIVSTACHRHFQAGSAYLGCRPKRTDELKVGDILTVYRGFKHFDTDLPEPDWKLGWMAIMIGDGCMTGKQANFTAQSPSRVLEDLPSLPPSCKLKHDRNSRYQVTLIRRRRYNPLVVMLKEEGLWGLKSQQKFVPDFVFRQNTERIAFFLRHLWNTDGTINTKGRQCCYVTTSPRLAFDVKYLCWKLSVVATMTDGSYWSEFAGRDVHRWIVRVSGNSYDRFMAALHGEEFESIPASYQKTMGRIKSIEKVEPEAVYCVETDHPLHAFFVDGILTENSRDQDSSDFASGEFHDILHDEPPTLAIWRENEARVMSVGGRLLLAMTWPDDPAIAVDWIFDEVYERGQPGVGKDPGTDCINLYTTDNPNIDQDAIATQARSWSPEMVAVRMRGEHIRFSNRIHPLFTASTQWWCFGCRSTTYLNASGGCSRCGSGATTTYNHVKEVETSRNPAVFALDPHPRKPHMYFWIQVTPEDDLVQIAEGQTEGDPNDVWDDVRRIEQERSISVAKRLIDPNMGRSPAGARRGVTWQDEFDRVGLICDLADDSDPGRSRFNDYLRPDAQTLVPRVTIDISCVQTIRQLLRYRWDDHSKRLEKDLKQLPKAKDDDFPTLWKYVMNDEPSFHDLRVGPQVIRRRRGRAA